MVSVKDHIKRKHLSKKNKKAWRINTNTSDVDNYLEGVGTEQRLGQGNLSEKKDEELFKVDKSPTLPEPESTESKIRRAHRKQWKPLRCFKVLENDSCIPGKVPRCGKNSVRIQNVNLKKSQKDVVVDSFRRSQRIAAAAANVCTTDLWEDDFKKPILPIDTTWLQSRTLVYTEQKFAKQFNAKPNMLTKKNSKLPAIEAPPPGQSYNPSYQDHQLLLQQIAEHEFQLIKEEKHIERVTSQMYGKRSERPTPESRLVEMMEGLPGLDKNIDENCDSDSEFCALNPPVQNRKKTKQKRRRMKEEYEKKLLHQSVKVEKKKLSDIYHLKKINDELTVTKAEQEKMRLLREKKHLLKADDTKQMSSHKYVEPEFQFTLPKDISGNVRNIRPEGNLLADRFKSLQKRNIIETRVKQKKSRKYKLKKIVKKYHKADS